VVPHHSTDYAINCLTAQIGRDAVGLVVYGRSLKVTDCRLLYNRCYTQVPSFSHCESRLVFSQSPSNKVHLGALLDGVHDAVEQTRRRDHGS
jgi:hypothetical protein